ncbi:MAG TPA: thermonuclease family protein [Desulfomonilaceae bacterium]|nr:thermonuclease family protein [Desulfomonilaceae bacterium]
MRSITASILTFFALLSLPCICMPEDRVFHANVLEVVSGDTIRLKRSDSGEVITAKLSGIDCPKKGQSHFIKARLFTSLRVSGREVMVQTETRSKTDEMPAAIIWYIDAGRKKSLNSELLEAGLGRWSVPCDMADVRLGDAENEAKKFRRGLWAEPGLAPPPGFGTVDR